MQCAVAVQLRKDLGQSVRAVCQHAHEPTHAKPAGLSHCLSQPCLCHDSSTGLVHTWPGPVARTVEPPKSRSRPDGVRVHRLRPNLEKSIVVGMARSSPPLQILRIDQASPANNYISRLWPACTKENSRPPKPYAARCLLRCSNPSHVYGVKVSGEALRAKHVASSHPVAVASSSGIVVTSQQSRAAAPAPRHWPAQNKQRRVAHAAAPKLTGHARCELHHVTHTPAAHPPCWCQLCTRS